jgi:hypothetical protein
MREELPHGVAGAQRRRGGTTAQAARDHGPDLTDRSCADHRETSLPGSCRCKRLAMGRRVVKGKRRRVVGQFEDSGVSCFSRCRRRCHHVGRASSARWSLQLDRGGPSVGRSDFPRSDRDSNLARHLFPCPRGYPASPRDATGQPESRPPIRSSALHKVSTTIGRWTRSRTRNIGMIPRT